MSPRDRELLAILSRHVRLLTLEQAARTWWGCTRDPVANALRAAKRLEQALWLQRVSVSARPELPLRAPVVTWRAGDPPPEFGAVAYRLQSRWTRPLERTTILIASERAGRQFGGRGGPLTHPTQVGHDLHVSALFLKLRTNRPDAVADWISEARLAAFRRHSKLPDAALGTSPDRLYRVIEFGNGYDRRRVTAFHDDCVERGIDYELW